MNFSVARFMAYIVLLFIAGVLMFAPPAFAQTKVSPYRSREVRPGFSPPGPTSLATPDTNNVYLYYPKFNMYMNVESEKYIYKKKDRWLIANQNPTTEPLGPSVTITSDSDKPYLNNSEHKEQYPYQSK